MTREEFKVLVKAMKAVYTHPSFIPDQHAFDVWYEMLKDLDYKIASYAVKKYMISEEREPNVASIRKHAATLMQDQNEQMNEVVAWGFVAKAINRSTYYSDEEFIKLPPIIQKVVGSPRQLYEWATMENLDGTGLNVIQSNFMRTYRLEVEREKEYQKLSPELLKLMRKQSDNIGISGKSGNQINTHKAEALPIKEAIPVPDRVKERKKELFGI